MPVKVLIADDNELVRSAIRKTLEEQPSKIEVVGEATSFATTIQMIGDLRPEVLLLDVHMAEKRALMPESVKSQLSGVCTLAMSFANDDDSKILAESYGALLLLDKMMLYTELIPAIMKFCKQIKPHPEPLLRNPLKRRPQAP